MSTAIAPYRGFRDHEPALLSAITRAPLAICKIWIDGTLVSVVEGAEHVGLAVAGQLAHHYEDAFTESPEAINCIKRAFSGFAESTTLKLGGLTWDARFFPASDPQRGGALGVMAVLTDASSRLAAFRLLRTLDTVATVGRCLARAESEDDFLTHTCTAIQEINPAWLGLVDRAAADRKLRIIAARGPLEDVFVSQDLSWDPTKKTGQTIAGEAIRTGQIQVANDIETSADCSLWRETARANGWTTALAIPLVTDGTSLGVLTLFGTGDIDNQELPLWEHIGKEITEGITLLRERASQADLAVARKEADDNYRRLIETAFDLIIQHQHGKIVEINTAGVQHAGARHREELLGAPFVSLVYPEDRTRVLEALQTEHEANGVLRRVEFRFLGLDASVTHVEGVTVPTLFRGQPAFLSVMRDISVRKTQERALSEAKSSLDYAQKIAKLGSIELDVASGTAVWSENALHIMNVASVSRENEFVTILGQALASRQVEQIRELVTRIRITATAGSAELTLPSGEHVKTVHIDGIPVVDDRANVSKVIFVTQDVTDLRTVEQGLLRATERLRIAQEIGKTGDFEIHVGTRQIQLSHGAKTIIGLPNRDGPVSVDTFFKCLAPTKDNALSGLLEQMLTGAAPTFTIDAMLSQHPHRWVNIEASFFSGPGESKLIGNIRDITDRKLIEQRLSESETRLKRAQLVARVWEFEWDVPADRVTWSESLAQVLRMKPPVDFMTFEQFLSGMSEEDRPVFRQAAMNTLRLGIPGECEYTQALYGDVRVRLVSRWESVKQVDGAATLIRGITQDITMWRTAQERTAHKHRFHQWSGLPNSPVVFDRITYLLDCASSGGQGFTLIVLKLDGYKLAHSLVAKDVFYDATKSAVVQTRLALSGVDTIARLERGRFAFILQCSENDVSAAEEKIQAIWRAAFTGLNPHVNVLSYTSHVRCPGESSDPDGILKLALLRVDAKTL